MYVLAVNTMLPVDSKFKLPVLEIVIPVPIMLLVDDDYDEAYDGDEWC